MIIIGKLDVVRRIAMLLIGAVNGINMEVIKI